MTTAERIYPTFEAFWSEVTKGPEFGAIRTLLDEPKKIHLEERVAGLVRAK